MSKREILGGNNAKDVKKLSGQLVKEDLELIKDKSVLLAVLGMVKWNRHIEFTYHYSNRDFIIQTLLDAGIITTSHIWPIFKSIYSGNDNFFTKKNSGYTYSQQRDTAYGMIVFMCQYFNPSVDLQFLKRRVTEVTCPF